MRRRINGDHKESIQERRLGGDLLRVIMSACMSYGFGRQTHRRARRDHGGFQPVARICRCSSHSGGGFYNQTHRCGFLISATKLSATTAAVW